MMDPDSDRRLAPGALSRRDFVRAATASASALAMGVGQSAAIGAPAATKPSPQTSSPTPPTAGPADAAAPPKPHAFLTEPDDYYDVSRGSPKPHKLVGDALVQARLTHASWRCEVVADPFTGEGVKEAATLSAPLTLDAGTALDLPTLTELAKKHRVLFLKAIQCLNIAAPLGQGVWEGVPLREVLRLAGTMRNVRRVYYWGFHNNDPKQVFQSSLSYTQVMETPPGEFPPFVAFKLNGEPISLARGGPVRMIIPWAHGFKSIKWLQRIAVTNDFKANDTYANQNNDPESFLKSAAYIDLSPERFAKDATVVMSGLAVVGYSGLSRVEYWVHRVEPGGPAVVQDDATYRAATWTPCDLQEPPADWSQVFPACISAKDVLGFDKKSGKPLTWPMRYSMVSWSAAIKGLRPGKYEFRARAVDLNGFAQPEPRPSQKSGKNAVEVRRFEVG